MRRSCCSRRVAEAAPLRARGRTAARESSSERIRRRAPRRRRRDRHLAANGRAWLKAEASTLTSATSQDLPFEDATFDCVVAAWMLYHVPDVDRALERVRTRPSPGRPADRRDELPRSLEPIALAGEHDPSSRVCVQRRERRNLAPEALSSVSRTTSMRGNDSLSRHETAESATSRASITRRARGRAMSRTCRASASIVRRHNDDLRRGRRRP